MPRPGLRPSHPSPHPRTPAHPPEAAALALLQGPLVGHASDQGGEGAVRAVGTVAPGLVAKTRALLDPAGPQAAPRPGRLPRDRPRRRQLGPAPSGAAPQRRLTSNVSKTHVRPHPTDVSAPLAWPGPPSRSALLHSAVLGSTPRTSAPGSSPTRQGLPGCPRPFCDARGRGSAHARGRAGGAAGKDGVTGGGASRLPDVRLPAVSSQASPSTATCGKLAFRGPRNALRRVKV